MLVFTATIFILVFLLYLGLYKTNEYVYILVRRYIFKERIIEIEGITSAIKGEYWKSPVRARPSGIVVAFRYPCHEIGIVVLNEDGTGKYCGDVIWKYIN